MAPVNTVPPMISGTPKVGKTLTASPGEWDVAGLKFSYQWQANGVDINGAKSASYKVKPKDLGKELTVVVTAKAAGKSPSGTAVSAPVTIK